MSTRGKGPAAAACPGKAAAGRAFTPARQPAKPDLPQPAPAHGTPVSADDLAKLKRRARHAPPLPGKAGQDEDSDR